jgi:hypothetical protein
MFKLATRSNFNPHLPVQNKSKPKTISPSPSILTPEQKRQWRKDYLARNTKNLDPDAKKKAYDAMSKDEKKESDEKERNARLERNKSARRRQQRIKDEYTKLSQEEKKKVDEKNDKVRKEKSKRRRENRQRRKEESES